MQEWIIYHNPKCSKSRETMALLQDAGIVPKVVEYLKNAPSEAEILLLMEQLKAKPADLVRTKEDLYKKLEFDLENRGEVARQLSKNPALLERPIVMRGNRGVIARPPEKVKELMN